MDAWIEFLKGLAIICLGGASLVQSLTIRNLRDRIVRLENRRNV